MDKEQIRDALHRYARGIDRADWDLVRSAYHVDAIDRHAEYQGDIDGFVDWLKQRFADADNGSHFLGNCLIEFQAADQALVETYFISQRLQAKVPSEGDRHAADDTLCRQSWGRYIDRFERRQGQWRISHRTVVLDSVFTFTVSAVARSDRIAWGRRNRDDYLYHAQSEVDGDTD